MPYTRHLEASKEHSQPMELHRFMNRPSCGDRKKPGKRVREIGCGVERVVICAELWVWPLAAGQFSEGNAEVVPKHISLSRLPGFFRSPHDGRFINRCNSI